MQWDEVLESKGKDHPLKTQSHNNNESRVHYHYKHAAATMKWAFEPTAAPELPLWRMLFDLLLFLFPTAVKAYDLLIG